MKSILLLVACALIYTVSADEVTEICKKLGQGYHLKEKTGCKSYYSCSEHEGEISGAEYECPAKLLFDDERKGCAPEGSFVCDSGPISPCPETGIDYIPMEGTGCQEYRLCLDGVAYNQKCSKGLLFDQELKGCDKAEKVECYECPNVDDKENIIYYADKKNCAGYKICMKGEPRQFYCANDLYYHEDNQHCVKKLSANCKYLDFTTPSTPTSTSTTEAPETPEPTEDPETPEPTEAPETPEPTEAPETPEPTEAPETPEPTEAPEEPEETEAPEVPEEP